MGLPAAASYQLSRLQPHAFVPFLKRLKKIFEFMDQKYQEAADYYGFNCKGCEDNCCLTRFYHYTLVEYLYIKEGFHRLQDKKQVEVKQRSLPVCQEYDEADIKGTPVKQMCPVNFENLCAIYPYRPMICRLTEYSPVITRMPDSRPLILNLAASIPVTEPAINPAANPALVARTGLVPLTISAAATAAPSVLEPSAVISGKSKMRKLMNTPNARSERIKPMVKAPMSKLMQSSSRETL